MRTKWIKISDTLIINKNFIVSFERFKRTFLDANLPTMYGLRIKIHNEEVINNYYGKEEERDLVYLEILNG